jgi:murein DD-endopeptidase MepM/ murein hydrolase activator NlpD
MAIIKGNTAKVQKGDTLSAIAKATGSTVDAIAKANNIANVNLIKPGQLFTIPPKTTGETPAVTPTETPTVAPTETPVGKTVVSTYIDPASGDTYSVYSDGSTGLLAKGTKAADALLEENRLRLQAQRETARIEAENQEKRQSAYDLLNTEFERYGLASLVTPLKDLITSGVSPSEFTLRLRETDAYKNRFAANQARIKNGLRALSEAEYIRNEDAYQEVMRRRGLPPEYYEQTVDPVTGIKKQKGFETLIAGDVSSTELEDRIVTAQDRVINANPEIAATLKQFYPGISNGDILAYTLDPANAINAIKRKVTAAEIGAAAGTFGLGATVSRAEQLAAAGVTEATAQQGFKTISQVAPRAEMLSQLYGQDAYTQETAEREFFGLTGASEAEKQRKKLTSLETAAFSGSAGSGVIARDRAGVI